MFSYLRRHRTAVVAAAIVGVSAASAGAAEAASYNYALGGSAKINNGRIVGSIPLNGTVTSDISDSGALTANVKINTVTASLTEFGVIPIKARVAFESVGGATGQLTGTTLTTTTTQTIRLLSATVFGVNIVQGSGCRTRKPSVITLTSNPFAPATGGKLSGNFAISELVNCGLLTWDLSGAIASNKNSVAATLTAK